jgi:Tol biopolymer transport system component/tRNA A-37 threonylcarbamoyl transferase component Bud32
LTSPLPRLTAALSDRYRIERELGQGGMATVYLAEDIKHKRKVALKVLKPELAAVLGAERFVQEITTTAALQHPHILPLFDSGTADGFLYYVMPFIDGETLRSKLDRETQLGVDEAVKITTDVADALDYAHHQGVIHRDIKPENILLHNGRPMVADFGIALALSAAAGGRMTETGLSLGTPHYMSPEQATAEKEISARSDVYSLASVLYEMLAGQPPHLGGSAQQIIMKIVTEVAQPVTAMRKSVPANVAAAVAKALEKLPADRFESARAFGEALSNPGFASTAFPARSSAVGSSRQGSNRLAVASGGIALAATALALWGWLRPGTPPPATVHEVVLGSMGTFPGIVSQGTALAPDGSAIVYVDTSAAGRPQLLLKERGDLVPRVLASLGTVVPGPVFSPGGESIAFVDGKLFRVSRQGGAPVVVSDSAMQSGMAWLDDGMIVAIARGGQAIFVVAPAGETRRIVTGDSAGITFLGMSAIPGEDALVVTTSPPSADVKVLDLSSGALSSLSLEGVQAWVVGEWLLYLSPGGAVYRAPFDARGRRITGASSAVLDSVQVSVDRQQVGDIVIGADGTALYVRRSAAAMDTRPHLVRISLEGVVERIGPSTGLQPSLLGGVDLSPDGQRIAVALADGASGRNDIYVTELRGGNPRRLTFEGTNNIRPSWSPDGRRIMYASDAGGTMQLWTMPADGSGPGGPLLPDRGIWSGDWSADEGWVVFRTDATVTGNRDIFAARLDGDTAHVPIATTPAAELSPVISPDGRWVAFSSDVTGVDQVYVLPFPQPSGPFRPVSSGLGFAPRWSHDGRRLFYQNLRGQVMAADVQTAPTFSVEREQVLFSGLGLLSYLYYPMFAVAPDDRHLIMLQSPPGALGEGARVVRLEHWLPR